MAKKILVIDDDYLVIRTLERYLKTSGYNIETAQSGQEGIEKAEKSIFDLIISDIRMPGMDGIETLKRIRELSLKQNKEKIPAIIITGYAGGDEIYRRAGELGIVDCIYKPFELDEFISVVRRNLELPPKYQRIYPRIEITFPVEVILKDLSTNTTKKVVGKTVDLSEDGIGLILDSLLPPSSVVNINISSSRRYKSFQVEALIVWGKPVFKDGYFRCGLHFLKIRDEHFSTLKDILADYKLLDSKFMFFVKEMKQFVEDIKNQFDEFDKQNNNEEKQFEFIGKNKKEIFNKLDNYFDKIWEIVKNYDRDKYIVHQHYYQQMLGYLLLELIQTNNHVYHKPLGYAGDFIMMNYIYDYYGDNKYLGSSTYEKLINNYTCNIPISSSNILRKKYLKEKIIETLDKTNETKILSVACGPAREVTELLIEGRINKPLIFTCLDFEKQALDFIDREIKKIELSKRKMFAIEYICSDITNIIRREELKEKIMGQHLVYAFGIYDYLSERMASRLTKELFQLVEKGGNLIICNASLKNSSHRAYYELLGEWNMVYRDKEEMLLWTKNISGISEIKFEKPSDTSKYLFLNIKRL